jgi:hypothetical protein
MVVRNTLVVFSMIFWNICSNGMEVGLFLNEDILQNVVSPYLTLQSIARFARTSKMYANIFEPGKIDICIPCFKKVDENYYRCTQALGRFALYNNTAMFKRLWIYDSDTRDKNVLFLEQKSDINLCDKMNVYRNCYSNVEDVDKNITEQLRDAIKNDVDVIDILVEHKKYNIFDLFKDDESLENAFQILCSRGCKGYIPYDTIFALLPVEDGEQKNRAVQYIAKYDDLSILIHLLKNGYLKANQEYGNKCMLLHYAALRGCRALTHDLLEQGVDIHVVNKWGKEPLYYAHLFHREHRDFGSWKYLYRGEGVAERLEKWCWDKHVQLDKRTQQCMRGTQSYLKVSEEEKDWLRNSCIYSFEALPILK